MIGIIINTLLVIVVIIIAIYLHIVNKKRIKTWQQFLGQTATCLRDVVETQKQIRVQMKQVEKNKEKSISLSSLNKAYKEVADEDEEKNQKEKTIIKTCLDCPDHKIIHDPDPHDWYSNHDMAVVCKLVKNPNIEPDSNYTSDRQEFRKSASSCRPYNLKKKSTIPDWCPRNKKRK